MGVGVMIDQNLKLRDLHVSDTIDGVVHTWGVFSFYYIRIKKDESQENKYHTKTMIHSEAGEA